MVVLLSYLNIVTERIGPSHALFFPRGGGGKWLFCGWLPLDLYTYPSSTFTWWERRRAEKRWEPGCWITISLFDALLCILRNYVIIIAAREREKKMIEEKFTDWCCFTKKNSSSFIWLIGFVRFPSGMEFSFSCSPFFNILQREHSRTVIFPMAKDFLVEISLKEDTRVVLVACERCCRKKSRAGLQSGWSFLLYRQESRSLSGAQVVWASCPWASNS